ncbi:universal stress protein [Cytophagales bacterium LB-30]|uniref:Universal stress protein n=1 Tax=Shiella aurantiaca TaxID=3058365 RepID=A0ABT8F385_9BACT|nr:universal stress protein [Shiella aurantiaca]MDN4164466.1 universal stress protein [Shiella aurantiaca]
MEKIIVPFDFSETAENALGLAAEIAQTQHVPLELWHVIEDMASLAMVGEAGAMNLSLWESYYSQLQEQTEARFKTLVLRYPSLRISYRVEVGSMYDQLIHPLSEVKNAWIIMGTQGAQGLKALYPGSTTEKVIRLAQSPVLAIKSPIALADLQKIAVAVDFHSLTEEYLLQIKFVQHVFQAHLSLVWVNTPSTFQKSREVLDQLHRLALKQLMTNYSVSVYNDYSIEEGIVDFALAEKASLIALATHGRTGWAHLFKGSITEDLANAVDLPVFSFRVIAE